MTPKRAESSERNYYSHEYIFALFFSASPIQLYSCMNSLATIHLPEISNCKLFELQVFHSLRYRETERHNEPKQKTNQQPDNN